MKKLQVKMLKGLPASGKSTVAKQLTDKGWKRVNKDDLRAMIDNGAWSRDREKQIVLAEFAMASQFLEGGYNVVVDDTNFAWEKEWRDLAEKYGAEFEVQFFDVPVMECVTRDAKRGKESVGAKAIFRMYEKYLKPELVEYNPDLPNIYIFDIDGTLAKMAGRSPYDYSLVHTDVINRDIVHLFKQLNNNTPIVVLSGRESSCEKETSQWLLDNEILYKELFMREAGDMRDDRIVKKELYEKYIKGKYNVLAVFDDRDRVVEMWRSLGLTCLQVYWGMF